MSKQKFETFDQFFEFYLMKHSHRATKWIHLLGTLTGLCLLIAAAVMRQPWYLLGALLGSYGVLFLSHWFIEKNNPATFSNPLWSIRADFRMAYLLLRRRL